MRAVYFAVMAGSLGCFYWAQSKAILTRDTKTIITAGLCATVGSILGQVLAARR